MKRERIILTLFFVFGLGAFSASSVALDCAQNEGQLKSLLLKLNIDSRWSHFIEGHWAKRAGGTGWHVLYMSQRLVFAVQSPLSGAKDAQHISICESKKGNDFTVQGKILGKNSVLEVKISGDDLRVMNGFGRGVFKKRQKSKAQIIDEFSDQLTKF